MICGDYMQWLVTQSFTTFMPFQKTRYVVTLCSLMEHLSI